MLIREQLKKTLGLREYTFERFMHLVLIAGIPLLLGIELLFLPELEHYAFVRVGLVLLSLTIYLGSYRLGLIRRDFTYINYVVLYLVISHMIFLTYVNGFPFFLSSLLMSLVLGASLFFRTRTQLLIFQVCMLLLVVQASILSWRQSEVDVPLFLILYLLMNASAFAIQDYIFRQRDKIAANARQLQRSNEYLQQFVYTISHDLQEPNRTVIQYMQLLERRYKGQLGPEADELIEYPVDASRRMQAMIQALLHYSRVGPEYLKRSDINLNEVLSSVTANLHVQIDENQATIHYPQLPDVRADRVMMTQLFQNLVSNAIKYKNGEDPVVNIDFERQPFGWEFTVSDNGQGIPEKDLTRLFDIFVRGPNDSGAKGSGIGLAVCRRIVLNHGGEIWIDSKVGEGSTFHFTITD